MIHNRLKGAGIALLLFGGLSACAMGPKPPSYPIPDEPGIYAFTSKNDLRRLDGNPEWEAETWPERANLTSNTHFVINDPALVGRPPGSSLQLWRVAWVRSDINANDQAMPVAGAQWAVAPIDPFGVPFRYESPADQPEIVHIAPSQPLAPGLYSLRVVEPGARQARIGVAWNSIDQRQYSAANCVDRYVAQGNAYRTCTSAIGAQAGAVVPSGIATAYSSGVSAPNMGLGSLTAPTAQIVTAPVPAPATSRGLEIALVDPVKRNDGLIIQGVVINTTGQYQAVPALQATLKNADGQDLRRWVFDPPVRELAPGQRANFKTEVRPLPAGVARANVAFIAGATM